MNSKTLTKIGLLLGMIGVILIFRWGPPQPSFVQGGSIQPEGDTIINNSGKTIDEYNQEIAKKESTFKFMSKVGLILIFVGFACQLTAIYIPEKVNNKKN